MNIRTIAISLCLLNIVVVVKAEVSGLDLLMKMSLEELLEVKLDVASNNARSILEQPGIISVISREQIINSGARDLLDIMRMVPGFGIAHDTAGIASWGFRGIWGHEGKIMLLIDGAPYNDPAWGNIQLGRHYPVELIAKVEVIRGPGAAKYGNYAELAMVKITTIGSERNGGYVDVNYRNMEGTFGSAELTAMYGEDVSEGVGYSVSLNVKDSNRTTLPFRNPDGSNETDQNYSPMDYVWLDTKVNVNDFTFSTLFEEYSFEHNESLAATADPETIIDQGYERLHLAVDYTNVMSEEWSVNANILYQEVVAHDMVVTTGEVYALPHGSHYRIETKRNIISTDVIYNLSENSSINVGFEYVKTKAISAAIGDFFSGFPDEDLRSSWFQGSTSDHLTFDQSSIFGQYENYNDIINFTLGIRFANNSAAADSVIVPRIAFSKKFDDLGVKLMYSEAFRTGDAEHINLADGILDPETLNATEIEFNYLADSGLYTINFFDMNLDDTITFNDEGSVSNAGGISSTGFEASWLDKGDGYEQQVSVSTYKGDKESLEVQLADDGESYLGFPRLKVTYRLNYQFSAKTNIQASVIYESKKFRREGVTSNTDVKLDSTILLNLTVGYQYSDNLTIRASVHDLLNEGYYYPQAYGSSLYPGMEREISLSVSYIF